MNVHLILTVFLVIFSVCTSAWSAPVSTYVAEFSVSGASKPEEMKTTLQALLLSRLAGESITTQVKPEGAEIKVTGSYLLSGALFSLDAAAVDRSGTVIIRAFTQGKSPDELIPAVGTLAKSLSEGIEKRLNVPTTPQRTPQETDIIKAAPLLPVAGQAVLKLDGALHGLAIGRTLPGGERELFVIGSHQLRFYLQGKELKLIAEIPFKVFEKILAVDTADIDGNGTPEIYLTVVSNETLNSQVWRVEGGALRRVAERLPYYFRTVAMQGGVRKLYAQQMASGSDFSGDVAEVRVKEGRYELHSPLKLPMSGYLYNFAIISAPEPAVTVVADRNGYLKAFSAAGDELSKGVEEIGGSETFFQRSETGGSGMRNVFLDQRMVLTAKGELLVAKNSSSWFMSGKHSYSKSSLYSFVWDGAHLNETWHTRQNDYYLADIAYDEKKRELLMLEVVSREEGVFDKGVSRLVVRKLD